jgi:hypothetical protein
VIERIVAPLGLRVDESSPWVDARLSDGSQVQTNFLNNPFPRGTEDSWTGLVFSPRSSVYYPIEPPAVRDALQLVFAAVLEHQAGAGDEILDG